MDNLVSHISSLGIGILPAVDNANDFHKKVPPALHPVNAVPIEEDEEHNGLCNRLLENIRLMRAKRSLFISYKRDDSRAVALQLYTAFDERSFDAFLDTHSVDPGALFQPRLWDRLGDADVLLLLDTPNAFSSRWVELEVSRAHAIGIGVLQIVWPGHTRSQGSSLCDIDYLTQEDFEDPTTLQRLKAAKALELVSKVEANRARSQAARRNRLVGELCRAAGELEHSVVVQPTGGVVLRKAGKSDSIIYPHTGHPDSHTIHDHHQHCAELPNRADAFDCVLFDTLGLLDVKTLHLTWLNEHLPLRACSVMEVLTWMKSR
jgi:hypothetical protein